MEKPIMFTEEYNDNRHMDNLLNPKGKSCFSCQWGCQGDNESKSEFITCGHHHENFSINSFCAFWTSPRDKELLRYKKEMRYYLKQKYSIK